VFLCLHPFSETFRNDQRFPKNGFDNVTATRQKRFMRDKTKILVVDDQVAVVTMIRFLLTRAGCETQGALDAEKALRLAQTEVFDLITLDVEMPGSSGFDLFMDLKQIPRLVETPIVFVAGNASIENQQRALDLGAADFIEKPFDTQDFLSRILSLVEETAAV
jgi:CheY-like chemotaxis protein